MTFVFLFNYNIIINNKGIAGYGKIKPDEKMTDWGLTS